MPPGPRKGPGFFVLDDRASTDLANTCLFSNSVLHLSCRWGDAPRTDQNLADHGLADQNVATEAPVEATKCKTCGLVPPPGACSTCRCPLPAEPGRRYCRECSGDTAERALAAKVGARETLVATSLAALRRRTAPQVAKRALRREHSAPVLRERAISDYMAVAEVANGRLRRLALLSATALATNRLRDPKRSPHQLILMLPSNPALAFQHKTVVAFKSGNTTRHAVLTHYPKGKPGPRVRNGACCPSCGHSLADHFECCLARNRRRQTCRCTAHLVAPV